MAFCACMYYAALRPAEVVGLRRQDCHLPKTGWGHLTLEKSRPEVNRRWTYGNSAHGERGLKHPGRRRYAQRAHPARAGRHSQRAYQHLRRRTGRAGLQQRPRPPRRLRRHQRCLGRSSHPGPGPRPGRLAPGRTPLRHAAVSLWLNAGVPATDVAERAGHSVEVLLRVYAKCLDDGEDTANTRIDAALRDA
jgi:integrase